MKSAEINTVKYGGNDIVKIVSGGWYYGNKSLKTSH